MMKDIEELLKFSPHILIFWRPDISSYKAYMLNPAKKGAKVENATATLLPSIEGREKGAEAFKIMTRTLNDDSDALEFLCPLQVRAALYILIFFCTTSCYDTSVDHMVIANKCPLRLPCCNCAAPFHAAADAVLASFTQSLHALQTQLAFVLHFLLSFNPKTRLHIF
jgi:hypothetical protein